MVVVTPIRAAHDARPLNMAFRLFIKNAPKVVVACTGTMAYTRTKIGTKAARTQRQKTQNKSQAKKN
jgi:hypothetical protein